MGNPVETNNDVDNRPLTNSNGTRSVTRKQMATMRKDIQVLKVQKDLNQALVDLINTHLNDARAEGMIDDDVRDQLLDKFLIEVEGLEKDIETKTLLVRLHELEKAQKALIQDYQAQIRKVYYDIESVKGTLPQIKNRELAQSEVTKYNYTIDAQPKQTFKADFASTLRVKWWPSSVKIVTTGGVILVLTFLGIRFGIRVFLSLGALLIVGAFFLRVFRD